MSNKMTYLEFVNKSVKVHGNQYLYPVETFNGSHNKTNIQCSLHGFFMQSPRKHIYQKQGCPICATIAKKALRRYSIEDFIREAKKVHGNEYDYSGSEYVNSRSYIHILCRKHGIFKQLSHGHLLGKGCPICRYEKSAKSNINNIKELIFDRFIKVHKNTYDYSIMVYNGMHRKVNIICKKHGIFKQTPNNHIVGAGCPLCYNKSHGEIYIANLLDDLRISFVRQMRFKECVNKRRLPFDFFLPDLNICIEYDGIMHFEPKFGNNSLSKTKYNDSLKNNFCFTAGIKLIRIPYTIKNIQDFLKRSLEDNKIILEA